MAEDEGNGTIVPTVSSLDLRTLPKIYVLPLHLSMAEVHKLEEQLSNAGGTVTYDISEARLVLGSLSTARRAKFELQCRGLRTEQGLFDRRVTTPEPMDSRSDISAYSERHETSIKRRRFDLKDDSDRSSSPVRNNGSISTQSETDATDDRNLAAATTLSQLSMSHSSREVATLEFDHHKPKPEPGSNSVSSTEVLLQDHIKVLKLEWLVNSINLGNLQPFHLYLVYEGRVMNAYPKPHSPTGHDKRGADDQEPNLQENTFSSSGTITGAVETNSNNPRRHYGKGEQIDSALPRDLSGRRFASSTQQATRQAASDSTVRPIRLLRETTSEHEIVTKSSLPDMPQWVSENKIYACERSTPNHSPNDDFIAQLKKIKLARLLTADEIGVRAYSTSIASLAAYPYRLTTVKEIIQLPGCDHKIAQLFQEWHTTGQIQAVDELEADATLTTLRCFYNIWGVGAISAREFYYDRGWKDLDDIIEFGWSTLSRVQQIGLKYYDEFELKIPRSEVEYIASIVIYHAKKIRGEGVECVIVGGYRRGNVENGDVDIILSHREDSMTSHMIIPVVEALEASGWITHTLSIHNTNSDRGQQPVAYKFDKTKKGSGFDTLDKALVVWQDPNWSSRCADLALDPKSKNPNVHRRVDIIISPWRTVGCAVSGWTSGTTFQRDLRRYAKHRKNWKFDSSGVRERGTGNWVDLERWTDVDRRAKTWQEAEKRVFEGLDLKYREPWERCTG
ncbi:hypothetical protein MMC19_005884 [Ptychographa xylographoides]|nr:hypothetical protein [Ptychographa xylographoides]